MPPPDVERGPVAAGPDSNCSVTSRRRFEEASAVDHRSRALGQRTAHRLAGIDRATDAELAAIVAAAIHELRQAETELCWLDIAPGVTA